MRLLIMLAVCSPLALRAGCDCGGEAMRFEPCVEDGGTAGGGGIGGGAAGFGGGGTGTSGGTGGGSSGADAGAAIPFDQLCEAVGTGMAGLLHAQLGECTPGLTPQDAQHVTVPGAEGRATLGDLVSSAACDGGPRGPASLWAMTAGTGQPVPFVQSSLPQLLSIAAGSIDNGRMAYDPVAAWQCRALGRALRDAGAVFIDTELIDAGPCTRVLVGLQPIDASCMSHDECASKHCRAASAAGCGGVCRPPLPAGAACDPDRDVCETECVDDGTWHCLVPEDGGATTVPIGMTCTRGAQPCDPSGLCVTDGGTTGRCVALAATGQRCGNAINGFAPCAAYCDRCASADGGATLCFPNDGAPCADDVACGQFTMYCRFPTTGAMVGACRLKPRPGEPCVIKGSPGGDCLWGDSYCRPMVPFGSTGVCEMNPALGEACGTTFPQSPYCRGDTFCDLDAGRCTAPRSLGQSCGDDFFGYGGCGWGLACTAGTCQTPPGPGQPCARADFCAVGNVCDAGLCVARAPLGTPCASGTECASGLCSPVTNQCAAPCNGSEGSGGCTCFGATSMMSMFLLYALVIAPERRRRLTTRRRHPPAASTPTSPGDP